MTQSACLLLSLIHKKVAKVTRIQQKHIFYTVFFLLPIEWKLNRHKEACELCPQYTSLGALQRRARPPKVVSYHHQHMSQLHMAIRHEVHLAQTFRHRKCIQPAQTTFHGVQVVLWQSICTISDRKNLANVSQEGQKMVMFMPMVHDKTLSPFSFMLHRYC